MPFLSDFFRDIVNRPRSHHFQPIRHKERRGSGQVEVVTAHCSCRWTGKTYTSVLTRSDTEAYVDAYTEWAHHRAQFK